jgi:hypothetical protein
MDLALELHGRKFAFADAVAAACGLARSPLGPIRAHTLGRILLQRAIREVVVAGKTDNGSLSKYHSTAQASLIDESDHYNRRKREIREVRGGMALVNPPAPNRQ